MQKKPKPEVIEREGEYFVVDANTGLPIGGRMDYGTPKSKRHPRGARTTFPWECYKEKFTKSEAQEFANQLCSYFAYLESVPPKARKGSDRHWK